MIMIYSERKFYNLYVLSNCFTASQASVDTIPNKMQSNVILFLTQTFLLRCS